MLRLTLRAAALRCLADSFLTNSSSHFLPREHENKLRFQIDAFRFYREPNNQVAAGPVLLAFCAFLVLTVATVNFHPDLCQLLREGGSSPSSRQPSEQGVLFNGEQVEAHPAATQGPAASPSLTPPLEFKEGG